MVEQNNMTDMFSSADPVAAMTSDSQQPVAGPGLFFESQHSGQRKRKASVVNELICQKKRGSRPATRSQGRLSNMSQ